MPWYSMCWCGGAELEDIKRLDYQHHMLTDVPSEVFTYERTLEELILEANHIRDLPRPLFHCHGLRVLSMSDNDVQSLPPAIASLINLQHLDLSRNGLTAIPDNIKGCKHLVYVDVSVNPLEKLPEGFTQLISLEELYLNDTFLEFLPANFGRLTKLKILELRENNLNTLPKSIARLVNLERLDIGQNEFSDFPEVVGSLVNLAELWADCNRIKGIPPFIGNLKKLMHLDASNNNINWVSPNIEKCHKLVDLTLSSNELLEIPKNIGHLRELVTLKLDDNQFSDLPNTVGQLTNLEELVLSQNDFSVLTPSVGLLRNLRLLNIDDNLLEELPSEIGSCSSLTILSVRSNRLVEVPAELGHLPSIRVINLADNLLRNLPVSILKLTQLSALWLSNNQSMPLPTLQQEVGAGGHTVCVNFMLPQCAQAVNLQEEATAISRASRPHIRFASDTDEEQPGRLTRAPTPYPKELRAMARHARSAQHNTRRAARENDDDAEVPLLGEMITPDPKDMLIKEAKVKKPTVHQRNRNMNHGESSPNEPAIIDAADRMVISTPVGLADSSPGAPVIREAKCIRQSGLGSEFGPAGSERLSIASCGSGGPQQPPPYHIAAVYSKQAVWFRQNTPPSTLPAIADGLQTPLLEKVEESQCSDSHSSSGGEETLLVRRAELTPLHAEKIAPLVAAEDSSSTDNSSADEEEQTASCNNQLDISQLPVEQSEGEGGETTCRETPDNTSADMIVLASECSYSRADVCKNQEFPEDSDNAPVTVLEDKNVLLLNSNGCLDDSLTRIEVETEAGEQLSPTVTALIKPVGVYSSVSGDISNKPSTNGQKLADGASAQNKIATESVPGQICEISGNAAVTDDSVSKDKDIEPPTFTQDKPTASDSIVVPTPQRLGLCPSSKLVTDSSRFSQSANSPVGVSSKITLPALSSVKSPTKIPLFTPHNVNSSVCHSPTRILQPGFHSNPKRDSLSSLSSGSRPGSIAPPPELASPSETGNNNLDTSTLLSRDVNLNQPSELHTSKNCSNGSTAIPSYGAHMDIKIKKEKNSPISKIPMPRGLRIESSPAKPLSSIPLPIQSPGRSSLDSPGTNSKTWMFGPHKNATVFPVVIQKNPGLGFSITGGSTSFPEKPENVH